MAKLEFKKVEQPADWDNFLKSLDRYSFLQSAKYTWVLETLAEKVERIGVYQADKLIALLPIASIKAKRGNYLRLWHGPVLSPIALEPKTFSGIISYLLDYAKKARLNFVRIQPIISDELILVKNGFYSAPTHNLDAEHTLQLTLAGRTKIEIFDAMRKNTRYYIRKSEREGTSVVIDNGDFESFYKLLTETAKRQGYTPRPKEYFERLFQAFMGDGLSLYFAMVENKKIAMGLFLDYGKYRFYLEGGMDPDYSSFFPAYAIQGRSVNDAIDKGVQIYDFWGGVSPKGEDGQVVKNYPWAGIDLFKRGFGGIESSIVHPHDFPLGLRYWFTWLFETVERKRRGY